MKSFRGLFHFSRHPWLLAAVLILPFFASGCATALNSENWNLNALRDDRAVDIDKRLEGNKPIVVNPF